MTSGPPAQPASTNNNGPQWAAAQHYAQPRSGECEWPALTDVANQIRVCSICPGPVDSQLRVSLRTINLDDNANEYICLSYSWGETAKTSSIELDGHLHFIHRNLHLQLLRVRAIGVTRPIWCDALCINQDDLQEQFTQIGMINRIVSCASQVLLCVDDTESNVLLQPAEGHTSTLQTAIRSMSDDSHLDTLNCFVSEDVGRVICNPSDGIVASQFRRLVSSSFYSRCWVLQEIVLAKEAMIVGEWGIIPWFLMIKAMERYNHHRKECCASFVDTLAEDVRAGCHKVRH